MRNNFTALCISYGVFDHLHHSSRRPSIGYACFYMPADSGTVGANTSSQPRLHQKATQFQTVLQPMYQIRAVATH